MALSGHELVQRTCPLLGAKRTYVFASQISAFDPKRTFAKIGLRLRSFGVRYHEALDFFRIKSALRCKANNFFGYDFN